MRHHPRWTLKPRPLRRHPRRLPTPDYRSRKTRWPKPRCSRSEREASSRPPQRDFPRARFRWTRRRRSFRRRIDRQRTFVFDETPITTPGEERRIPRPRNMRRGGVGGSGNKKVLVALLALILLGGGGAAYYFLWPQSSSEGANGNSGTSGSNAGGTLDSPSDTTASIVPDTNDTNDTTDTTEPGATETPSDGTETGTTEPPPSTTAPPTTAPPTTGPTPTSPSDTPPVRAPTPVSPSRPTGRPMAQGAQQLRSGNYPQASAIFLRHLRSVGADRFTIAVGVFCDTSNVGRVVNNSGGAQELIVLAFDNQGRSCYRVFWGIFDTRLEAERAVGTVPAGVLARDSAPVPIDRLLP